MVRSHNLEPEKNMEYKIVTAANAGSLEKSGAPAAPSFFTRRAISRMQT